MNNEKQEKLVQLDTLVLDKMIEYISNGKEDYIKELTTAVQYLKANQVVEQATKGDHDPIEERKKKLEEVKKRRENT